MIILAVIATTACLGYRFRQPLRRAWFRHRYCRRGLHREGQWIVTACYRHVYCIDCAKHLIMRRRDAQADGEDLASMGRIS